MNVEIIRAPTEEDWLGVKERALVTIGKTVRTPPTSEWKHKILKARHSPIRYLMFSYKITDLPSWVATHMARHVHAQPYIRSQRNDRQDSYDRNAARQDTPVTMIFDVNAEEMQVIANKRLCNNAAKETRELVEIMCKLAEKHTPELQGLLVPMCVYCGGKCPEMHPCNSCK